MSNIVDLTVKKLRHELAFIGNTPMVTITMLIDGRPRPVHLKLEGLNPGGSVKDRAAAALIRNLEQCGMLHKGMSLVDSSSSNLAIGATWIAKALGYGFIAVVDPKTTHENLGRLAQLGAEIVMVREPDVYGGYLLTRIAKAREIGGNSPRRVWTNQYSSFANPLAHQCTTGPEILRQLHGEVDAVFAAVSTGGTLAGLAACFRQHCARASVVAVDAAGSIALGGTPAPRRLTGIGASRPSSFLTTESYDHSYWVTDAVAFAFCRALRRWTGISVGGSAGAVLAACARHLAANPGIGHCCCVCPDSGNNYGSTIFNDAWLAAEGLDLTDNLLHPVTGIDLADHWARSLAA